jgi:hypothetical protein
MGHLKLGATGVALALSTGAAFMPPVAHADTPAADVSTLISDYGQPTDTNLTLANIGSDNTNSAATLGADTATPLTTAIVGTSASTPGLDALSVSASGGQVGQDSIPEPATGTIALVAGVGFLARRRRKLA